MAYGKHAIRMTYVLKLEIWYYLKRDFADFARNPVMEDAVVLVRLQKKLLGLLIPSFHHLPEANNISKDFMLPGYAFKKRNGSCTSNISNNRKIRIRCSKTFKIAYNYRVLPFVTELNWWDRQFLLNYRTQSDMLHIFIERKLFY